MSDSITIQNSDGETFAEVIDVIGVSEVKKAFQQSVKEGSLHNWFKGSKSKNDKPGWVNVVTKKKMNEDVKRDEYGDPIGGPKISKKQKAKNLAANTPDEQHNTRMGESRDVCYHKVKVRYPVFPSAREEYIPEEGYDHMRDRALEKGTWKSNPKKSDATTRPVSKEIRNQKGETVGQKEFKKKYGKNATAFDAVKQDIEKKHGKGAIMNVKKEEVELVETPKVDQKLRKDAKPIKGGGLYKTGMNKKVMGDRAVMARRNLRNAMSRGGVGSMTPAKETAERREKHKASRGVKKEEYSDWREEIEYLEEIPGVSTAIKSGITAGARQIAKRGAKRAAKRAAIKVAGKSGGKAAKKAGTVAAREGKKAAAETAAAVGQGVSKGLKKRKEKFVAKVKRKSEEIVSGEDKKKPQNVNEFVQGQLDKVQKTTVDTAQKSGAAMSKELVKGVGKAAAIGAGAYVGAKIIGKGIDALPGGKKKKKKK